MSTVYNEGNPNCTHEWFNFHDANDRLCEKCRRHELRPDSDLALLIVANNELAAVKTNASELMEAYLAKVEECEDVQDQLCKEIDRCLSLTEERNQLRNILNSVRSSIRLVCNRDKITEWTMASLREAEAEIDVALRDEEDPRG